MHGVLRGAGDAGYWIHGPAQGSRLTAQGKNRVEGRWLMVEGIMTKVTGSRLKVHGGNNAVFGLRLTALGETEGV
jgi:hypothetical protein